MNSNCGTQSVTNKKNQKNLIMYCTHNLNDFTQSNHEQ